MKKSQNPKYFQVFLFLSIWSVLYSCATKKDLMNLNQEMHSEISQMRGEINAMLMDSDGDGVPDYLDVEANTPIGARVDSQGRMLDSDGDGIPDHLDKCPFVPGPASTNGCPVEELMEALNPRDPNRSDQFWPIPTPTYIEDITDQFIGINDSLEAVYGKIRKHLQKKGNQFNRVMYVPEDGFVVFSNLERINDSGTKLSLPIEIEKGGCSILNILHCLYGKPSGRYVFFAFVVNNGKGLSTTNDIKEYNDIMKYINRGYINLDNSYVRDIYNNPISAAGYTVSLLAYEYETYPGRVPKLVLNTKIDYFKLLFK
jgi:hypothetical protein